MPLPEVYIIPPLLHSHILFTQPTHPQPASHATRSRSPLGEYNQSKAFLLPSPFPAPLDAMTTKRVHWDDAPRRTPSPALSTGSQHSSVGPWTPPTVSATLPHIVGSHPAHYYGTHLTPATPYMQPLPLPSSPVVPMSPGASSSSSSASGSPLGLAVHDLLSRELHAHGNTRPFDWNMIDSPVMALGPGAHSQYEYLLPPARLAEPATTPPAAEVRIQCEFLPWTIAVRPSPFYGNIFVTVGDVLQQLYEALRLQVSADELRAVQAMRGESEDAVVRAYAARCAAAHHRRDEEKKGVRRVDCLKGTTRFGGIKVVRAKPQSVELALMLKLR